MPKTEEKLLKNQDLMIAINKVFIERSHCRTEWELGAVCLSILEDLTKSKFGFIGEINLAGTFDTIAISNPGMDICKIPEGQKTLVIRNMPIRGVDRSVIREGQSRIVNGEEAIKKHPDHIPLPKGHPPVKAFLGVPLYDASGKLFGMVGLGNKEGGYTANDQEAVEAISVTIVEVFNSKRVEDKIVLKTKEILEISTSVLQVFKGVVVAPLIGTLNSQRTQNFIEKLLNTIIDTNSSVALIDITGVPTIDTATSQHIIEAINATKLLGAKVILTGVRPVIAQTLVHLGIDLSGIETRSSLSAGLYFALETLGMEVVEKRI